MTNNDSTVDFIVQKADSLIDKISRNPNNIGFPNEVLNIIEEMKNQISKASSTKSEQLKISNEANYALFEKVHEIYGDSSDINEMIKKLVLAFEEHGNFDAVGIRLKDNNDFPYFIQKGFPKEYSHKQDIICALDIDGNIINDDNDTPILECICGAVLKGNTDCQKQYFTKIGSFWTNDISVFYNKLSKNDPIKTYFRDKCLKEGFNSIALLPIKAKGEIYGLIQLNKKEKNFFSEEIIHFYEKIANSIGIAVLNKEFEINLFETKKMALEHKELLTITFNSIGDAVITTDLIGNITNMNPVAEKLCACNIESARGKALIDFFNIVNSDSRKPVENPVKIVLEKGNVVGLANHTVLISKDGTEYHISDSAAPIKDKEGNMIGVVMVFSDISEKYAAERKIYESKIKAERYLNIASQIIVSLNLQGNITLLNDNAYSVLGYNKNELIGKNWFDTFISSVDKDKVKRVFNNLLKGNTSSSRNQENDILTKKGELRRFIWHNSVIKDSRGNPVEVLCSGIDITDKRLTELQLIERNKELNALYEISALSEKTQLQLNDILQYITDIIPSSMQFPKIAHCRIVFKNHYQPTKNEI
jgi:PAS domain S-box-containing protein